MSKSNPRIRMEGGCYTIVFQRPGSPFTWICEGQSKEAAANAMDEAQRLMSYDALIEQASKALYQLRADRLSMAIETLTEMVGIAQPAPVVYPTQEEKLQ